MALFLGFCTENLPFALALGLVLELFWLDALRLGLIVPPSGTFSFLLLYPLCLLFHWYLPSLLPLPLVLCLAFGYAASWLEQWQRRKNAVYDAHLQAWVEQTTSDISPATLPACSSPSSRCFFESNAESSSKNILPLSPTEIIAFSRWFIFWSAAALYVLCFSVLYGFFYWLEKVYIVPSVPTVSWNMLYGLGLLGAVLSLRTKQAYAVLAMAFVFLFMWYAVK